MTQSGDGVRVLHVDHDPQVRHAVTARLADDAVAVESVSTSGAAVEELADGRFDCVVSGHDEQALDSVALLETVRSEYPDLPFLLFTDGGSEALASEAVAAGVTEYLTRDGDDGYRTLVDRVERTIAEYRATTPIEQQEQRLSTLVSNLPGMVYRCRNEPGWLMQFVSAGVRELTGYEPDALESGQIDWETDVVHPEDRDDIREAVQSALDTGEPFEVTYRIETADGHRRWLWERGQLLTRDDETEVLEGFITDITARKEQRRALEEQRAYVEDVLNSLEDLFYVITPDWSLRQWNEQVVDVTGYSDEEIAEMTALEFIAPEDVPTVEAAIGRAIESGSSRYEAAVQTKSGETIPYEFHGTALSDTTGEFLGIAGVGRDVTERKEREQTLRQYETLAESVADPMYVMAPDGTIEMINDALADHIGYERSEIVGASPEEFVVGDGVERAEERIRELLTTDRDVATFEMRTVDDDGEETYNETKIAVMTDGDGEFEGTAGVIRDITERMERQRELERYETILQAVGDPVYTLDAEGQFTVVNDAMAALSGYDREQLVGEHISKLMTPEDVAAGEDLIAELLADPDRTNGTFEMGLRTADGTQITCENHVALLPADDGRFRGTAGVIRDITERKQRERQLEQFASVVSHDLRSPLNVVQGRVNHAMATGELEHLEDAADAAHRMEALIDDLLTLAREGQRVGDLEPVALDVVAEAAWSQLDADEKQLVTETDSRVEADFDRLQELFDNLFRNALTHGGAETVRVVDTDDGFAVVDDGTGIPPTQRETIFERGFTTSEEGTGFGLAIVDTIVRAHDWSITVGQSDADGARFEVTT